MKLPAILCRNRNLQYVAKVNLGGDKLIGFLFYNEEDITSHMKVIVELDGGFPIMVELNPADQFCRYLHE